MFRKENKMPPRKFNDDSEITYQFIGGRNRPGKMSACESCGSQRWVALENLKTSAFCVECKRHPPKNSIERTCPHCGKVFRVRMSRVEHEICCSKKCSLAYRQRETADCLVCGNSFKMHNPAAKYCSKKCSFIARFSKVTLQCAACGKEFRVIRSRANQSKYCSHICANSGERNPSFKHGYYVGDSHGHPYGGSWESTRKRIKQRDGNRCRFPGCNKTNDLEVHHIEPFDIYAPPEPQNVDENLITFCKDHHKLVQSKIRKR